MRAVVTGGAGFIGSHIVHALVDQGAEVCVIDNLSSGFVSNLHHKPVRFVRGDIRDPAVLAVALADQNVVFHLAASVGNKRSIDDPVADAETNVLGTIRLLEAARQRGIEKIVVSSSAGVFGELKRIPINEDHSVEPDTPYGCTKLCEEKLALAYSKLYGIEAICLRYFNVFGPNQRFDAYGNVIPIFVFQMLRGEPITVYGDGEQTRDFIHVRDVVQANLRAASTRGISGAFNIGSGSRITINHLVELIQQASGIKLVVRHGPARPGDVRDSLADISAARRVFGFEPNVDIEEGLAEYIAWARREIAA